MGVRPAGFLVNQKNAPQTAAGWMKEQFNVVLAQYQRLSARDANSIPPAAARGRDIPPEPKRANRLDRLEDYDLSVLPFWWIPVLPSPTIKARGTSACQIKRENLRRFRTFKRPQE